MTGVAFPSLPPLPTADDGGGYATVKADPPWSYDDDLPGPGRGSNSHYDTLDPSMVSGMGPQVNEVTAPNAHLYLGTARESRRSRRA